MSKQVHEFRVRSYNFITQNLFRFRKLRNYRVLFMCRSSPLDLYQSCLSFSFVTRLHRPSLRYPRTLRGSVTATGAMAHRLSTTGLILAGSHAELCSPHSMGRLDARHATHSLDPVLVQFSCFNSFLEDRIHLRKACGGGV